MKIVDRFLKYTTFETTSDENSSTIPSTKGQLEFGAYLVEELKSIGIDAYQDNYGYVYGTLPGTDSSAPVVGLVAHMDTSPDMSGKNVAAKIVDYNGGDIKLNEEYSIKVEEFPVLNEFIGEKIITTDGTTLLGSDDKAGIAVIITVVEELLKENNALYPTIKIAFTPDEEIGRGADKFNIDEFGADFAYTVDGGPVGEIRYENFNAARAKVFFKGRGVHPGRAKNTMVNAGELAMEFHSLFPKVEKPEHTENKEGFIHLYNFKGDVESASLDYIIRDHDLEKFNKKKDLIEKAKDFINFKYGDFVTTEITDSYYNMGDLVKKRMEIVDLAFKSVEEAGIEAKIVPIRGGTDGARLSYMGLICPDIFGGGYNYHGRYEFLPICNLLKSKVSVKNLVKNISKYKDIFLA